MIFHFMRRELAGYMLRVEYLLAILLVPALALVLADSGFREQQRLQDNFRRNQSARDRLLDEADNYWNARNAAAPVRPLAPLRPLAQGDERVQADVAEARPEGYTFITGLGTNPLPDLLPAADTTFIIGVVLGLFVILLGHDSVTGEREDGTLKLVFSFPVSRAAFLAGKWAGGMAAVGLVLAATALAVVLAGTLRLPAGLTPDDYKAGTLLLLAAFLYLGSFYTLSLLVSTACDRSSTSLVTLTLLWAVTVLILPNTTPLLADWITRAPGRMEAKARIEAEKADLMRGYMEARRKILAKFEGDEAWRRIRDMRDALEKKEDRARKEVLDEFGPQWKALNKLSARLALASPFAAFTLASSRLCQTDPVTRTRLKDALAVYDKTVETHLDGLIERRSGHRGGRNFGEAYRGSDVPAFEPSYETFTVRAAAVQLNLIVLALGNLALFFAAMLLFTRRELA